MNTSDLLKPMMMAGQNIIDCLNPDKNYIPYWEMSINPDNTAEYNHGWTNHNIGRWWDAVARLEKTAGFVIPETYCSAMLENAYRYFDNADSLCFVPIGDEASPPPIDLHSLREGMLALNALIAMRNTEWACVKSRLMAETVGSILNDDFTWNVSRLDYYKRTGLGLSYIADATGTHGRFIEALVWNYMITGDVGVLSLAKRLAEWHYENSTTAEGGINPRAAVEHTHSYFGTLRGLYLFGKLTKQQKYTDRVYRCYIATVNRLVKKSGYASHDIGTEYRGETTSPGDAAQLALWLALDGYTELLDDAERIVRSRLLPSQITSVPKLMPVKDDGTDRHKDLSRRAIGAFGGMHRHPHGGKINTTDITCADIHTLADIYSHIAVTSDGCRYILFHFDYDGAGISTRCVRNGTNCSLTVTCEEGQPLMVRLPSWVDKSSVCLTVNGDGKRPEYIGSFINIGTMRGAAAVVIEYGLPEYRYSETAEGKTYDFLWRGDEITGISPNAEFLPFYHDLV